MTRQAKKEEIGRPEVIKWVTHRAANSAIVISFVLGYLLSLMGAWSLTPILFIAFTTVNGLCGVLLWWIYVRNNMSKRQLALSLIALSLLTFVSGMSTAVGLGFNWLLYFVAVGTYFTYLSIRTAAIASGLLYLALEINMFIANGWQGVFPGWAALLAGFCFVAAFCLSNRLLKREQERSQRLIRQQEASNCELEQAHHQLQAYASEVKALAVAGERTRLAREIHDTLGHYLTILSIQLKTIGKLQERDPDRAAVEVEEAERVVAQCLQEVRNAVAALRPMSIATLNIIEALAQLGNEFRVAAPDVELTLDQDISLPPLPAELQLAFYRAAQEALTNVHKHAHATKVLVRLRYEDELLELVVRDNGKGFSHDHGRQQTVGFGLIGLRERIVLLNGQVTYGPLEPYGYRVTVRMRVPQTNTDQPRFDLVKKEEVV
jgi:signal transduction histidine kinase